MNWFIPAFVSSSPESGGGISEEEGTRWWARSSKKRRNVSRICRPSMGRLSLRALISRALELLFPLAHRLASLGDRLADEPGDVHQAPPRLPREVRRRHLARLLPPEPQRHPRAGRPRAQAEREPEDAPHAFLLP